MRDRSQRLHWIETLIGKDRQEARRNNALVIPTDDGDMAIAFSSIVEVVAASRVQPLALLPEQFCGVLFRGNELAPIVDTRAPTLDRGTSCSSKGKDACWGCSSTARPTSSTSTKPNMPSWPSSAVRASRRERFPCWISTP